MSSRPPVPPRFGTPLPPRPGTSAPTIGVRAPVVPPKPQGLIGAITQGGIESIAEMGGGGMNPIWIVAIRGAAYKVVLKLERQFKDGNYKNTPHLAKGNIKAMSDVMSTVSPSATMEAVSPRELDALQAFPGLPDSLKTSLPNVRTGAFNLVKMKYDSSFASHSNKGVEQGGFSSMSDKEKDEARKLLEAIRGKRRVWQNLGSITIADALIGNNDRVDISNGGVTNFGNLIFSRATDGTITHALGLDAIDPASNLEKMLYGTDIQDWTHKFGAKIKSKSGFISFAESVIKELNERRLVPLGLKPFGHAEIAAFAEGMVIGWDKLANSIGAKVRQGKGIPSGLMARAKYLGWVR